MKFKDDQLTRNLDHLMARLQQRRSSVRIFSFAESAKPLGYIEQSQLTRSDASIGELTSPITATCGMRKIAGNRQCRFSRVLRRPSDSPAPAD
ncbi:MAG: hypothetical protein WB420_24955 [Bradyrhizobium sp.]